MTKDMYGVKFETGDVSKMTEKYRYSLVVCQHVAQDSEGRLHLCRLYDKAMWRVFTITPRGVPVQDGFSLARVVEFRLDRNGYLNLVVSPMVHLGQDEVRFSPVWEYLRTMMSPVAYGGFWQGDKSKLHTEELLPKADSMEHLLESGRAYFDEMEKKLLAVPAADRFAETWLKAYSTREFKEKYPLLAAKYATPEGNAKHEIERRKEFLQKTFDLMGTNIKECSEEEVFQKCENLLEERKAKKAESKKNKKAKKA